MTHSALIFLDLDHFKLINDARGHKVGDKVLILVAQRLRESVGSRGDLVRLGGDEFIVLIKDNAARIESAIVDEIEKAIHVPAYVDGIRFALSSSIGIALCECNYAKPDELLRDADIAMYRAKAAGRSRREFFDRSMSDKNITSLGSGSCPEQAATSE
jgi:diguanylate cyclase (GGDEF)-like protein